MVLSPVLADPDRVRHNFGTMVALADLHKVEIQMPSSGRMIELAGEHEAEEATFPFFSRSDFHGVPSGRAHRLYKEFETAIDRIIGDRVRADGALAVDLWSALANVEWRDPEGWRVSYSFRRAGEVVVWIREEGDYLDWYCSTEPGIVADWISDALAAEGWSWTTSSV